MARQAGVELPSEAEIRASAETIFDLITDFEGQSRWLKRSSAFRGTAGPSDNPAMGDLVLAAKEGFAFSLDSKGDEFVVPNEIPTAGAHGFLSTEPKMNAIFVAAGAGIKRGMNLTTIENIDVAPTMARLLGVTLESAAGRVLDEILEPVQSEPTPRPARLIAPLWRCYASVPKTNSSAPAAASWINSFPATAAPVTQCCWIVARWKFACCRFRPLWP